MLCCAAPFQSERAFAQNHPISKHKEHSMNKLLTLFALFVW